MNRDRDIVFDKVSKSFGDKPVLRDFSARFAASRTTALMGPSGCGKTTVLNLLMGFERPDAGTITRPAGRIGAVFQEERLAEGFSALGNLRMILGRRHDEGELVRHLTELGLPAEQLGQPVRTFSGGMRRRVAIARAVLYRAPLLLLDEPFKGLDEESRLAAIRYLKRHSEGVTTLLVTHDPKEAELLSAELLTLTPVDDRPRPDLA
ncbi:MAG: ATP-binding cassette domain-containing protein [Clostridia bacterium]|nr:ATP-binding cassette domain-containing protein [Clostridia bacterium]